MSAGAVELKVRSSDFRTRTRCQALAEATNHGDALWRAAAGLLERSLSDELLPVRLLGMGAGRLTRQGCVQRDLFDQGRRERQGKLDRAVDAIRGRFGPGAIRRGSLVDLTDAGQVEGD
jgi:DNA polymerase-4